MKKRRKCDRCNGTGIVVRTEWVEEDTSYEVESKCPDCNDNDD